MRYMLIFLLLFAMGCGMDDDAVSQSGAELDWTCGTPEIPEDAHDGR